MPAPSIEELSNRYRSLTNEIFEVNSGLSYLCSHKLLARVNKPVEAFLQSEQFKMVRIPKVPFEGSFGEYKEIPQLRNLLWHYLDWIEDENAIYPSDVPANLRNKWMIDGQVYAMPIVCDSGEISIFESLEDALAGKRKERPVQTAFKSILCSSNPDLIRGCCEAVGWKTGDYEIEFLDHCIDDAYIEMNDSLRSCMTHERDYYTNLSEETHPTEAYNNSDLKLALLRKKSSNTITARAMVFPRRMLFTRVYGEVATLSRLLALKGFSYGTPIGARMPLKDRNGCETGISDEEILCPYIDQTSRKISSEDILEATSGDNIFDIIGGSHGAAEVRIKYDPDWGEPVLVITSRTQINGYELEVRTADEYEDGYICLAPYQGSVITCSKCENKTVDWEHYIDPLNNNEKEKVCLKCMPDAELVKAFNGAFTPIDNLVDIQHPTHSETILKADIPDNVITYNGAYFSPNEYVEINGIPCNKKAVSKDVTTGEYYPLDSATQHHAAVIKSKSDYQESLCVPDIRNLRALIEAMETPELLEDELTINLRTADSQALINLLGNNTDDTMRGSNANETRIRPNQRRERNESVQLRGASATSVIIDDPYLEEAERVRNDAQTG